MSRGESYGGGQSSLGYLFGSDDQQNSAPPPSPIIVCIPPYGIDDAVTTTTTTLTGRPTTKSPNPLPPPPKDQNLSNNYLRSEGQNSGNCITGRPSTKVKSVPGGDSSLGYLFGDK